MTDQINAGAGPSAETLQQWYNDAIAARQALATGEALVHVRGRDREMTYSRATLSDLNTYIGELATQLKAAGIDVYNPRRYGRSRRIRF